MERYEHQKIEAKWQKKWEEAQAHSAPDHTGEKNYLLIEFPYPSGDGLHVGHVRSWTALDVVARKRRAEGKNVLYPIGWDAFGLPTENYAIKTGKNPKDVTKENTDNFRRQIKSVGLSFDWSREINTTDPAYYKWTQWIFLKMYEKGLAYKAKTLINWCPKDKIGLANEEVVDGCCERCGTPVEKREKEQWMLAITKYAQRLYDDLDTVDYIERAKVQQRNWIGPSEGAEIDFALSLPQFSGEVVFASNNEGKLKRMKKLIAEAGLSIVLKTPKEVGIENFDVKEDGATLVENSEKKAKTLVTLANLPVLADDSGFFIENEEIDPVTVKRNALNGIDEKTLSIEEIAQLMQKYYADIAQKRGGRVDAEWRNNLCFIDSNKSVYHIETVRPVILTSESRGKVDPYLPLRGLYISKATNKYVLEQTEEEELIELQPVTEGIKKVFTPYIKIFTTRPDTLFGATYMVLSPEHPLIKNLIEKAENGKEIASYATAAKNKSEIERTAEGKEKTGVEIKGIKAINPATNQEIPIYVADYVLAGYGTGAIMAVPAHDERDFAFAKKFNLPITQVVEPKFVADPKQEGAIVEGMPMIRREAVAVIVRNPKDNTYLVISWKGLRMHGLVTGGIDEGEDMVEAAKREVLEETGYKNLKLVRDPKLTINTFFYHRVKKQNRHAHFHYLEFELENEEKDEVNEKEAALHEVLWKTKDELKDFFTVFEGGFTLEYLDNPNYLFTGAGLLGNSGEFTGMESEEAKRKITEKVGGKIVTTFKLRDWVFSRQRYWGEPIPMINCPKDGWVAVPEKDLPVMLPEVEKYQPTDTGESPLSTMDEWVHTTCPACGGPAKRETDVMPNWAGSSWYWLRYTDPKNDTEFASQEKLKYWTPVDWYNGGMEHTVLHLLYSRFWHKFLFDLGLVPTSEPYMKRTSHGLILAEDGSKMSKSKGNTVSPDEIVKTFGADSLRMYEMFVGPFDQPVSWSTSSIMGVRRFLERVMKLSGHVSASTGSATDMSEELAILLNQTIKKVGEDIEALKMNTAVSSLMVLLNKLEEQDQVSKQEFEVFIKLLAPFAPHISNELAEINGIDLSVWPTYDEAKLASDTVTLAVQVNGKARGTVVVGRGASEEEVVEVVAANPTLAKWLPEGALQEGKIGVKVIYVPGKIISFVSPQGA